MNDNKANQFLVEKIVYNNENIIQQSHINKNQTDIVRNIYNELDNDLHLIYNFTYFTRDNEEKQVGHLITNVKKSVKINFILNTTNIKSIDFYDSENKDNYSLYNINKLNAAHIVNNFFNNNIDNSNDNLLNFKTSKSENINKKEIKPEKEIEESLYQYGNPTVVFKNLDLYVQLIVNTDTTSLIVSGQPGVGKTYTVTNSLEKLNADFVKITGRSTAYSLYIALYENNGKIIIFDDCDKVLLDTDSQSILKAALDSGKNRNISWLSKGEIKTDSGEIVPSSFDFTGKCIFITNIPLKKLNETLISRSYVIEISFTPEDMIKYLYSIVENIDIDCPDIIKRQALHFIVIAYRRGYDIELSVRSVIKAIYIQYLDIEINEAVDLIAQQCKKIK